MDAFFALEEFWHSGQAAEKTTCGKVYMEFVNDLSVVESEVVEGD